MIYLAAPYSDPEPALRQVRFELVLVATVALLRTGCPVYSPLVGGHVLAQRGLPTDWSFWEDLDRRILSVCTELVVLTLPGWNHSVGVQAEMALARDLQLPVRYLDPLTLSVSPEGVYRLEALP